jgi:hypothetical protein
VLGIFLALFRAHRDLVLENAVLRHQLAVALRSNPKPRLRQRERILWVWLTRFWPRRWRQHLLVVQPATVIGWHRKGWRLYWTWRSRTRLGRPRLSSEVRELIAEMSRDNPLWGTERIRGELLKLGIVVSARSIRRYRWRDPAAARVGRAGEPSSAISSRASGQPTFLWSRLSAFGPCTCSSSPATTDESWCT